MLKSRHGQPRELLKPGAHAEAPAKDDDARMTFVEGDTLFHQGDSGGDLFFIEAGVIEIFTEKDGETIVLAEMKQGEIIGVMTCLTSDKRMASARAKTPASVKRVPHASIKRVLAILPNWMKIVLKEFTIRLTQMNRVYSEAVVRIKKLEALQITSVYTGAQAAAAFSVLSAFMAKSMDDRRVVFVDDVIDKLELVLNIKADELRRVFQVLMEAGLLKVEVEPQSKRQIARLDDAVKLGFFAQFVRESRHGAMRKLVRARFTNRETRVLSAIVKLAARLGVDLEKTCRLPLAELERSLERATGVRFERIALDKGLKLKLLALETGPTGDHLVMKPAYLGRTVACIEAIRKLTALDRPAGGQQLDAA